MAKRIGRTIEQMLSSAKKRTSVGDNECTLIELLRLLDADAKPDIINKRHSITGMYYHIATYGKYGFVATTLRKVEMLKRYK